MALGVFFLACAELMHLVEPLVTFSMMKVCTKSGCVGFFWYDLREAAVT